MDGAGKSTVLAKLLHESTDMISPTFGFQIKTVEMENFMLNLWDIGGQSTIRSYWKNYYEETDGVVWVIDSADSGRLQEVHQELESVFKEERLQSVSLLILANKQDIVGAMQSETVAQKLDLENGLKSHNWKIIECSAITGRNIEEGFVWLLQEIKERLFYLNR